MSGSGLFFVLYLLVYLVPSTSTALTFRAQFTTLMAEDRKFTNLWKTRGKWQVLLLFSSLRFSCLFGFLLHQQILTFHAQFTTPCASNPTCINPKDIIFSGNSKTIHQLRTNHISFSRQKNPDFASDPRATSITKTWRCPLLFFSYTRIPGAVAVKTDFVRYYCHVYTLQL